MRKRGREAWAKWGGLVGEQKRSGQSVAAFCRERGISAPQLFAWKKRLSQAATQQFVPVRVVDADQPQSGCAIEIRFSGGPSVIVGPGFDAGHLRAVVAALETRA
jgi:hypothetical protein